MEPNLVRKDMKYQKKILVMVSILVISLFMGGSFALLSSSSETEEVVTFKTGELNMEVATTGTLSLEGEVPKSYDDGFKSNDITITLTNTGTLEIGKYEVKLEGDSTTTLDNKYIRYSISEDDEKTYLAAKLLSETDNTIYTGYNLKTSKVLKLKIWIDEEAGEAALKKIYNGKINVELYQKGDSDTAVQVVKSKLVSNYSGSKEDFNGGVVGVNNEGLLYHEVNNEAIREYRYSGPNVNNYVTFNNELWRIIGVFKEGEEEFVKIIRNNNLTSNLVPTTYNYKGKNYSLLNNELYKAEDIVCWNNPNNTLNDWTTAGVQYWLNTTHDDSSNPISGYLNLIDGKYQDMIRSTTYYLGNIYHMKVDYTAYQKERDATNIHSNNSSTWIGKIALMYPSDYLYSKTIPVWQSGLETYKISTQNTWMVKNGDISSHNWLWVLSPSITFNNDSNMAITLNIQDGYFGVEGVKYPHGIRPTLYLKSDVKIESGDGTETNAYKLILE